VLFEDGHWVCRWCGATLDIPVDRNLVGSDVSDGPGLDRHVIKADGRTVHECVLPKQDVA
jgi:hypothetical protein